MCSIIACGGLMRTGKTSTVIKNVGVLTETMKKKASAQPIFIHNMSLNKKNTYLQENLDKIEPMQIVSIKELPGTEESISEFSPEMFRVLEQFVDSIEEKKERRMVFVMYDDLHLYEKHVKENMEAYMDQLMQISEKKYKFIKVVLCFTFIDHNALGHVYRSKKMFRINSRSFPVFKISVNGRSFSFKNDDTKFNRVFVKKTTSCHLCREEFENLEHRIIRKYHRYVKFVSYDDFEEVMGKRECFGALCIQCISKQKITNLDIKTVEYTRPRVTIRIFQ